MTFQPPQIPNDRWATKLKTTATGAILIAFGVATFMRHSPPVVYVSLVVLGLLTVDGEVLLAPLTAYVNLAIALIKAWKGSNGQS